MPRSVKKCLESWENLDQCRPPECDRTLNHHRDAMLSSLHISHSAKGLRTKGICRYQEGRSQGRGSFQNMIWNGKAGRRSDGENHRHDRMV